MSGTYRPGRKARKGKAVWLMASCRSASGANACAPSVFNRFSLREPGFDLRFSQPPAPSPLKQSHRRRLHGCSRLAMSGTYRPDAERKKRRLLTMSSTRIPADSQHSIDPCFSPRPPRLCANRVLTYAFPCPLAPLPPCPLAPFSYPNKPATARLSASERAGSRSWVSRLARIPGR